MGKLNTGLLALVTAVFVLSGCFSLPVIDPPRITKETNTFYVSVKSTPSDAEVYLNGALIGRTPAVEVPIVVGSSVNKDWGDITGCVDGPYVLTISKRGYKTEAVPLKFQHIGYGRIKIVNSDGQPAERAAYGVTLQPEAGEMQDSPGDTSRLEAVSDEIKKANDIEKYKELMDKGVITKEEFEQKKKQLLGL